MLASIFSLNVIQTALELGCIYALPNLVNYQVSGHAFCCPSVKRLRTLGGIT